MTIEKIINSKWVSSNITHEHKNGYISEFYAKVDHGFTVGYAWGRTEIEAKEVARLICEDHNAKIKQPV